MTSTYGEGGAGGKLRRQPHRRQQSTTPYARPPTQLSKSRLDSTDSTSAASGGWLSRIVDPAKRLISDGATRFLPSSFFSKSSSAAPLPLPDPDIDSDKDANCEDQVQETDLGSSRFPEDAGHIRSDNVSNLDTRQENTDIIDKDNGLSEIEQVMKGKLFSRDEANRLTEILHLKAAQNSDDQGEMRNLSKTRQSDSRIDLPAKELPRLLSEEERENLSYATWEHVATTPLRRPTLLEGVGASPVDVAKAYMESISTRAATPYRSALQDKTLADQKDGFTSLPMLPPSSSKASICWAGAMVHERRGYLTPQNPRSKYGLYSSQRSPYSRTIDSKSKLKHQLTPSVDRHTSLHVSESPYRRTLTLGPTQGDASVDGYRSVGPIRSKRHTKVTQVPFRGSTASSHKPVADHGTLPVFKTGDSGSARSIFHASGIQSPHPHSSQMARRILDQIDRKVPTLREKTEEIRIASLGQRTSPSKLTTSLLEMDKSALSNGSTSLSGCLESQKFLAPNLFGIDSNSVPAQGGDAGSLDSQKYNAQQLSSSMVNEGTGAKSDTSSLFNQVNGQCGLASSDTAVGPKVPVVMKGQQSHSFGNKPALASISINRPNPRSQIALGNSSGFTFPVPVPAPSGSEPPTPSITPAKVSQQHVEEPSTPLFTFGSKKTSPCLAFSFASASSLTNQVDDSDIKFHFRSDATNRISFSAFGKNTIDTK